MSVRETIQRKPKLMGLIAVLVIMLAGVVIARQMNAPKVGLPPAQIWYTEDDGLTWFADRADLITPFDHQGKQAVRAVLFTCDGGNTSFLGYLQRYTPGAQERSDKAKAEGKPFHELARQIKPARTAESQWTSSDSPMGMKIQRVTCPGGGVDHIEAWFPGR